MKIPSSAVSGFSGMQIRMIEGGRVAYETRLNAALDDGWVLLQEFPLEVVWLHDGRRRESMYSIMVFKMGDDVERREVDPPRKVEWGKAMSPGQVAFAAYVAVRIEADDPPKAKLWDDLTVERQRVFEELAQAVRGAYYDELRESYSG